jgi:hypothetical protein
MGYNGFTNHKGYPMATYYFDSSEDINGYLGGFLDGPSYMDNPVDLEDLLEDHPEIKPDIRLQRIKVFLQHSEEPTDFNKLLLATRDSLINHGHQVLPVNF